MASDMVVALARATTDQTVLFGFNANRPREDRLSLVSQPAHDCVPGENVHTTFLDLPQSRHTFSVLASPAPQEWGYLFGVNERGVAVASTPIHARFDDSDSGLRASDLVRLTLERASTALQALEILTDLITRHGQCKGVADTGHNAFVLVDAHEAALVEAAGQHWVLANIGSVRAVTGECMLRQDWDRISRGLSELGVANGWVRQDGCKLDFAGAIGRAGPDQLICLRRWGQATLSLEQHSGRIDRNRIRRCLRDLAGALNRRESSQSAIQTRSSFLVHLGPTSEDLPLVWWTMGSPTMSIYLPVFVGAELPQGYTVSEENQERTSARSDGSLGYGQHAELISLQQWIDEQTQEVLPEARQLWKNGRRADLNQLATSFMQHCSERLHELEPIAQASPASDIFAYRT